jgi:hypothetical protein
MSKVLFSPSVEAKKPKKEAVKYSPSVEAAKPIEDNGAMDTALDIAYGVAQGATFNFADEAYGAGRAALDKFEDPATTFNEAYEKHRNDARGRWALAKERSPVGSTLGEIGGAVVSPVSKVMAPGRGLKGIFRAASEGGAQSYGATDKEDLRGQAIDSGKGAALGGTVGAGMNVLTQRFSKSPNATRSEVLGVKAKDYHVDGPGDRKQIVERIKNTGMLKNRKMEYDVDKMEFIPTGKSKFKIDELEKNTEERLLNRAQDATDKLQAKKEAYYGKLLDNRFVSSSEVDKMVSEVADEYIKRGLVKGPMSRAEAVSKIQENMYDQVMHLGGNMSRFSLRELDQLKRMAQEDVKNFSKGLAELGDNEELARITARKLKNLVENKIGDDGFKKINSAQHDFLTVSSDLKNKLKSLELAAPAKQHIEKTNAVEGLLDSFLGGSQGRLDSAARKEWYQNVIPEPVRAVIPYAAEEAPNAVYRQKFQGNEMKGNWRNPSSIPNIPEEFIRTPLPRSTDGLMKNKNFVLGKIAQMAPEMFEGVKDVFENSPEQLPEIAQVLSQKMPHFFEKDKYNRFDGRVLSEADKQKAIKDTLLRKDISSIDQAKIITRLNKEGLYDD